MFAVRPDSSREQLLKLEENFENKYITVSLYFQKWRTALTDHCMWRTTTSRKMTLYMLVLYGKVYRMELSQIAIFLKFSKGSKNNSHKFINVYFITLKHFTSLLWRPVKLSTPKHQSTTLRETPARFASQLTRGYHCTPCEPNLLFL